MDIRMICMDLDGTALLKDRTSFSPDLIRALEEAHERGIAIVPVTGRQYGLLPEAVKNHPVWENLVVTCNGGQIRRLAPAGAHDAEFMRLIVAAHQMVGQVLRLPEPLVQINLTADHCGHLRHGFPPFRSCGGKEPPACCFPSAGRPSGSGVQVQRPICSPPLRIRKSRIARIYYICKMRNCQLECDEKFSNCVILY